MYVPISWKKYSQLKLINRQTHYITRPITRTHIQYIHTMMFQKHSHKKKLYKQLTCWLFSEIS